MNMSRDVIALNLQAHRRELARLERDTNASPKELEIERRAVQRFENLRALYP
jgi:hypothetical protein